MQPPRVPPGRTRGWVVGRVADAPVVVSPGWLVAAVLLTVVLAPTAQRLPAVAGPAGGHLLAAAFVLMLFVSVFLHELGHALVARRRGIVVRELAVTLLGGHTQLGSAAPGPGSSALVAVAGPSANLVLAAVTWLLAQVLGPWSVAGVLVAGAAVANAVVGAVNLVPALPLDGGRVLESLVWHLTGDRWRGTLVAGWAGRAAALGLVAWMVLPPVLAGGPPSLLRIGWAALLGAFLWSGAGAAVGLARRERRVAGLTVANLMVPAVPVPARGTVADLDALADAAPTHVPGRTVPGTRSATDPGTAVVLVDSRGRPLAVVDPAALAGVPPARRATTPLDAVARPLPEDAVVPHDLAGPDAVEAVAAVARRTGTLAVVADGRVVGVLTAAAIIGVLRGR